jgi:glycine/D-amino acid oxidase-like deaminating enzyme
MFPEFVHELEDESGMRVDLREGALVTREELGGVAGTRELDEAELRKLEPCLEYRPGLHFVEEGSVDTRALMSALVHAARHRGVHIATGLTAIAVRRNDAQLVLETDRTEFTAPVVVNCCGAWAAQIIHEGKFAIPARPVKGQMLSLVSGRRDLLKHIVRTAGLYLVPRSDGRLLVGATLEEAGFDKRVTPEVAQKFHQLAANLVPELGEARILEAWAGLRPGTPDDLPILGPTDVPGYFVATGHYRNGILLAPITAAIMANLLRGLEPSCDVAPFSPNRFARQASSQPSQEFTHLRRAR